MKKLTHKEVLNELNNILKTSSNGEVDEDFLNQYNNSYFDFTDLLVELSPLLVGTLLPKEEKLVLYHKHAPEDSFSHNDIVGADSSFNEYSMFGYVEFTKEEKNDPKIADPEDTHREYALTTLEYGNLVEGKSYEMDDLTDNIKDLLVKDGPNIVSQMLYEV